MDKKEALIKLESLEKETTELRKIIEAPDKPKPVTERIKTFSDACKELGINPTQITNNTLDTKDEIAYKKLKIIAKALNEGWSPDWNNSSQYKYYPYFEYKNNAFCYCDYSNDGYSSSVGSALYLKSKDLAIYIGKQFNTEYNEYLNP